MIIKTVYHNRITYTTPMGEGEGRYEQTLSRYSSKPLSLPQAERLVRRETDERAVVVCVQAALLS